MPLIQKLTEKLARHPKRIVFPEGSDPRIIQAARLFASRQLGVPILLGDRALIKSNARRLGISLDHIRLIEPQRSDEFESFVERFQGLRRFRGLSQKECHEYVAETNYFATMMLATMQADAILSGATSSASSAIRPLLKIIPKQEGVQTISSLQILDFDEDSHRSELFLSDCAVVPDPSPEQLTDIALTAAHLRTHLTNEVARVAMLSYTTKNTNSRNPSVLKVRSATEMAQKRVLENKWSFKIDGDLQVDAALDPATADTKQVGGDVAGRANVLIFPDLNSGNISSKMIQILGGAHCYGHILSGLSRPAAEISRGASAHDIFGTAVLVCAQAIERSFLYPMETKGSE
ncbi:phosphate acyltransferase [Puniceicoccus vermicola]|uniref:Phosphate acetyltransferase n=1 Tax=Puniceicoccus vermicola TaxID=388746 RepID=A0A7X1AY46_9BACT|nr:phosphate acyltransferase [Puniceicoccus vermicola]MBC2600975.1 phosphate acetyltransferase [Puniceicoccus vermicola]